MKLTAAATVVFSLCVSLASAGLVTIPVKPEHVVPKDSGDCFFGVTTPQGCAPLRKS
ncbi:hypothetical protein VTK26DRAFT_8407 [Humicola hyalothermophila]